MPRKPPRKPPSQREERRHRGPHYSLRFAANIHTQALRQDGVAPDEVRERVLGYLREAWESGASAGETECRNGEVYGSPSAVFAYALYLDESLYSCSGDSSLSDEHALEMAAAVVRREIDRELSDPGYTNRPGYRDELMF